MPCINDGWWLRQEMQTKHDRGEDGGQEGEQENILTAMTAWGRRKSFNLDD